jgi:hypothetical protein
MYVIRRHSDGWYYYGSQEGFGPDINQAQTYLAPPALSKSWMVANGDDVWMEERESASVSVPVILGISLALWVGVSLLVRWLFPILCHCHVQ